jgi:hypothetical protein
LITGFENITHSLNDEELELIPILVKGFKNHNEDNPIKAKAIIREMNAFLSKKGMGYKLSEPRLRKCCNYIRTNGLLPLIATSKGYYVSYNKEEIRNQIESLTQRANSINGCAYGLQKFLTQ